MSSTFDQSLLRFKPIDDPAMATSTSLSHQHRAMIAEPCSHDPSMTTAAQAPSMVLGAMATAATTTPQPSVFGAAMRSLTPPRPGFGASRQHRVMAAEPYSDDAHRTHHHDHDHDDHVYGSSLLSAFPMSVNPDSAAGLRFPTDPHSGGPCHIDPMSGRADLSCRRDQMEETARQRNHHDGQARMRHHSTLPAATNAAGTSVDSGTMSGFTTKHVVDGASFSSSARRPLEMDGMFAHPKYPASSAFRPPAPLGASEPDCVPSCPGDQNVRQRDQDESRSQYRQAQEPSMDTQGFGVHQVTGSAPMTPSSTPTTSTTLQATTPANSSGYDTPPALHRPFADPTSAFGQPLMPPAALPHRPLNLSNMAASNRPSTTYPSAEQRRNTGTGTRTGSAPSASTSSTSVPASPSWQTPAVQTHARQQQLHQPQPELPKSLHESRTSATGSDEPKTAPSKKKKSKVRSYTKLFVGQVPLWLNAKQWLADLFAPYGVREIVVRTVKGRATAFLWCGSRDQAEAAVTALDGFKYENNNVWYSLCVEPSTSSV